MDWKILLLIALLALACPIGMSLAMRRKRRSHDHGGMGRHEEGGSARLNADPNARLAKLQDQQVAVEREIAASRVERRPGSDGKQ